MKIITIIDYATNIGHNYINMTKICLNLIRRHSPSFNIELLYVNENNNLLFSDDYQRFIKSFDNLSLKKLEPMKYNYRGGNANHKATYDYKHAVWNEKAPYIFIDTDLFVFSDINNFYNQVGDSPFAATGHGSYNRKQEKSLNGGFYYMGKTGFVDPTEALKLYKSEYPDAPTLDQNVLFCYLNHLNYDPFIVPESERWNWFGRETKPLRVNGEYKALDHQDKEVHGVHFFGNFKPWRCKPWLEFWNKELEVVKEMSQ